MKSMWSWFRRRITGDRAKPYTWYDQGPDNPFGIRVLDIRSLTQTMVSTSSSLEIAQTFSELRKSGGPEFASSKLDPVTIEECSLILPHDGAELEGIVFKADAMEVKWDIYAYDSQFLFVRSWTGDLVYRADFDVCDDRLTVDRIEASPTHGDKAIQCVYYLLASHAMGRVFPNPITDENLDDPELIALASFSEFGNRAFYATHDDVTQVPVLGPESGTG